MAFQASNVNLQHHASSKAFSERVNSFGVHLAAGADATTSLGVVRAKPPAGLARIIVRADAAYAAGESNAFSLTFLNASGSAVTKALATASAANVGAAGEFVLAEDVPVEIDAGAVAALVADYTAGGGPNDPAVSVTIQLY